MGTRPGVRLRSGVAVLVLTVVGALGGCGDGPTEIEFEVIEDLDFAASLDIDLATFQRRNTGVYWKDIAVGAGEEAVFATFITITFTAWIADGTQVLQGTERFLMGNSAVISGIEDGILNQRVGGTRTVIIPPNRGYAGQGLIDIETGEEVVPPGAVLVYEITVDEVETAG